jgi:hypothetical protein
LRNDYISTSSYNIVKKHLNYIIRGGYKNEVLQPFNEVLATFLSKRLGFKHVPYEIKIVNNKIVSSCPCFIDTNTECEVSSGHYRIRQIESEVV